MIATVIVGCALGAWFMVCVACQLPLPMTRALRRFDLIGLVPDWRFFAPRPATKDFYLMFRDRLVDGTCTDWTELETLAPRPWWGALWNPDRRVRKAMFDLTTELAGELAVTTDTTVKLTVPYLALLAFVAAQRRSSASACTQFMILQAGGDQDDHEALFLSDFHEVAA